MTRHSKCGKGGLMFFLIFSAQSMHIKLALPQATWLSIFLLENE